MVRLAVVVPYYQHIEPECMKSIAALNESMLFELTMIKAKGALLPMVRNQLLIDASDYDYILTVDSDIAFTLDQIESAFHRDLDVVAFPYKMKHFGCYEGAYYTNDNCDSFGDKFPLTTSGFKKVNGWIGAGLMLFKTKILKPMIFPWYHSPIIKADNEHGQDIAGEDFGFCRRIQEVGLKIHVDFDQPATHIVRDDEKGNRTISLEPLEIGFVLKGLNELPRKVSDPIYRKICNQVGVNGN